MPIGGGTFLSCCEELPGLGWGGEATAEVDRTDEDTVGGGGTGDSPGRDKRPHNRFIHVNLFLYKHGETVW